MFSYLHISKVHAQIPICELGLLSCTCFTVGLGSTGEKMESVQGYDHSEGGNFGGRIWS